MVSSKRLNSSILPIVETLRGTTNPDRSVPGSNDNEEVFYVPQSCSTGSSLSDSLESYLRHS